ncbi:hypothetical protein CVS40_5796 [Lucilia cuprina]|nr:hypothetical protein CVS40_5796 [Lucilia cuprina]
MIETFDEGREFQDEVSLKYEDACEQYQILKAKIMEMIKAKAPEQKGKIVHQSSLKLSSVEIQTYDAGFTK